MRNLLDTPEIVVLVVVLSIVLALVLPLVLLPFATIECVPPEGSVINDINSDDMDRSSIGITTNGNIGVRIGDGPVGIDLYNGSVGFMP